ncbi:MAG: 16S rRNA (adenine(1518)-N(6)/adenine(1519)-N(6))-dimethyltransferase RsmA [Actinomycetota bacterium]
MTVDPSRPAASSTSRPRRSPSSRRSAGASSTSASAGSGATGGGPRGLGAGAVRELAARHGIRPSKALGQHFLIDPNLAGAIASEAGASPGDRVVEVGAGLGSLTLALAATGARVRAIEFDRALLPALHEVTAGVDNIDVVAADATRIGWASELRDGPWILCANLPYNVALPVVMAVLAEASTVRRLVILLQREVGERLVAGPGDEHYGPASVRVAYRATGELTRRVPPSVFWPQPKVASVVVRLERLASPPVDIEPERLWRVVDAGFAERRKTMRSAVIRLGLVPGRADDLLREQGIDPRARAEQLSLAEFARIAEALP